VMDRPVSQAGCQRELARLGAPGPMHQRSRARPNQTAPLRR
jgi:hypothetical protein